MSIDEALELFLAAKRATGKRASTVGWYKDQIRGFLSWLEKGGVNGSTWLKPETIEKFLAEERQRVSAHSVAGRYRALKVWFDWLVKRKLLAASPMVQIEPPQTPKKAPRRTELDEYEALLESIPQTGWLNLRDRLAINVMFLCGLRVSELCALRADDFNVTTKVLMVRSGKGDRDRYVPLLPAVTTAFVMYLYERPAWRDGSLMLSADVNGNPRGVILPNGLRLMLRRRCRSAGVRYLNPHSFRHGLAVYLLNQGGDMSLVQKILGHSRISTTAEHYADWVMDGVVREFVGKMGKIGKKNE